jgi:hypothetical protein
MFRLAKGAVQFWGEFSVLSLSKDAGLAGAACFDKLSTLVAPKSDMHPLAKVGHH